MIDLEKDTGLALWQAYCEMKMKCESLQEKLDSRVDGWISVDTALPEIDQKIIMCDEFGSRFSGIGDVLIKTNKMPEPFSGSGRRARYTHWQPMPPAPTK